MADEKITTKQEWYDLKPYKDEIGMFVKKKKVDLDVTTNMEKNYNTFYKIIFSGSEEADIERFPHAAEQYKVYKSALIESSLSGYSALVELTGRDAQSELKIPQLKKVMTDQFKEMSLLENLSGETLDDWILKGEAVAFIKLKENKEEYRVKETITDDTTGEELASVKIVQGVSYKSIDVERIDPLDFFVDALDYQKDPLGCTKIIRSWIDSKTLLSSDAYPLLSKEDKVGIVESVGRNGQGSYFNWGSINSNNTRNQSDKNKIEVLTFYGDYITNDNKVLNNIKAVVVGNIIASLEYNKVSINRIIYAPYKVDRTTHRSISPLCSTLPVNKLINRVVDLFIRNLQDTTDPIMLYKAGSMTAQQAKEARTKRQLEYIDVDGQGAPEFWSPPMANPTGLQLMEMILNENKSMLGLNQYMAGDSSGAVRTAEESSILFQRANARMRVETDVFSYRFMLNLFTTFYAFNRELALAMESPLDEIYADPELSVSISTNASKADREGELQRLMQMLNLPIAQMIFSNLQPDQVILAVRYLMAKADLQDGDNLLELLDANGQPTTYVSPEEQQQQLDMQQQMMQMQQMPQDNIQ